MTSLVQSAIVNILVKTNHVLSKQTPLACDAVKFMKVLDLCVCLFSIFVCVKFCSHLLLLLFWGDLSDVRADKLLLS